ncbi:hypothetical protein FK530_19130 [Tsukamurella conjunctivitidis]|uniref:Tail assembly chaperone n=1 Tax=Tsukamurella conjunctivitidis TaxID=2592068 RepID=A0A5C5RWZ8_9ACTN|nr:hypothetical protein [Tsukamurella conjunctivitidis]TWS27262.1 hypothetical protein FK530_19130 [Tsukamurella conjunctivitidis]
MAKKADTQGPELVEDLDAVETPDEQAEEKPAPKPGDADYDWSAHYPADAKLFRHTLPNGKVIAIREFGAIYSKGWLYKIRNFDSDVDFQFAAIDRAACETAQALIASVDTPVDGDADPFDELWSAWVAAATSHDGEKGMTPGE